MGVRVVHPPIMLPQPSLPSARLVAGLVVGLLVPAGLLLALRASDDPVTVLPGGLAVAGVAVAAAIGGRIPAAVSGVATVGVLWWAMLEPRHSFAVDDLSDAVGLVGFAVAAAVITWLVSRLTTAQESTRRSLETERVARLEAEAAAHRARRLHRFTSTLAGVADEQAILGQLVEAAAGFVSGASVTIMTSPEELARFPIAEHAARTREAASEQAADGVVAAFPVVSAGEVAGVLAVQDTDGRAGALAEGANLALRTTVEIAGQAILRLRLELLEREQVAQRRTTALRAQLDAEHALYEALQQAALPPRLPDVAGVRLVAQYQPALEHVGIGGDWYDAFLLDDGRLGLCVADVAGHGVEAASVMAQLRNGLRAYAFEGLEPDEVLGRLDRLLARLETSLFASVVYAIYDPDGSTLRWSNAGHPPPVLFGPDGTTLLDRAEARGPVLGWSLGPPGSSTVAVPELGGVLLYTDGLVERRGEHIDTGLDRLVDALAAQAAVGAASDLRALIDGVRGTADDDLCVLVVERVGSDVVAAP